MDQRLLYLIKRLMRKPTYLGFDAEALRIIQLSPAGSRDVAAAVMLPGMLDRARQCPASADLETQKRIARGGLMPYPSTDIYELGDALIEQTSVLVNGRGQSLGWKGTAREVLSGVGQHCEKIESALLVSNHHSITYFGDWLFENTARVLFAKELGYKAVAVSVSPPYSHEPRYKAIWGLNYEGFARARIKNLMVMSEGHTPLKAQKFLQLRAIARNRVGNRKNHGVFVIRGRSGQTRHLVNEQECIDWATSKGFSIVDPAKMSVDQLLDEMHDAKWIVGVEGSGLLHGLLVMHPEGVMLGIVAADRFIVSSKDYADALNLRTALIVADKGGIDGFTLDIAELEQTYHLAQGSQALAGAYPEPVFDD